ncbi:hypothetical protein FB451DRAFT_1294198 [Mycena latifolia]|nr:hypothetical protein FB451DRAFT_1294198 [Mycena latifolia]
MFLDLCVELLQEIANQLDRSDHKSLRAVCKDLSFAMEPLFFSSLVLKTHELRHHRWFFQALATEKTGWTPFIKTLRIISGQLELDSEEVADMGLPLPEHATQDLLISALWSIRNARTIIWRVGQDAPGWERNTISYFINTLHSLNDLQLDLQEPIYLQLGDLPCLRKLEIRARDGMAEPLVQHVSEVVAQSRSLTSLHLPESSAWSEVWKVLGNKTELRLKEISTPTVTPALIAYLVSYSGIEKLNLQSLDKGSEDRLADNFANRVLPRHAESLVELSCISQYPSRWSFGTHNVDAISQLYKLTRLEMSVNLAEVTLANSTTNAVHLLLRTAGLLPALCTLIICPASHARPGGVYHRITRLISTAVTNFKTHVHSSTIVHVHHKLFELKPVNVADAAKDSEEFLGYLEIP